MDTHLPWLDIGLSGYPVGRGKLDKRVSTFQP
jgi:hypothetical protein